MDRVLDLLSEDELGYLDGARRRRPADRARRNRGGRTERAAVAGRTMDGLLDGSGERSRHLGAAGSPHKRFLVSNAVETAQPITLIFNWPLKLAAR